MVAAPIRLETAVLSRREGFVHPLRNTISHQTGCNAANMLLIGGHSSPLVPSPPPPGYVLPSM